MPVRSHGSSRNADGTRNYLYAAWSSIKQRCFNPKSDLYAKYGGRGITMHPAWVESFVAFRDYVGERPSPSHSIDRKRNAGNYEPGNVRWATPSEQAANQRDRDRVMRKTDSLLLDLAPKLSRMGFSMRSIAALFGVGKTTIEKALRGRIKVVGERDGRLLVCERRRVNHPKIVRRRA